MRFFPSLVLGISTMVLALAACGDDGGTAGTSGAGGAGGGGAGGAGSTVATTSAVTGPTATTSTGAGMCDGSPFGDPCGPCLEGACCQELIDDGGTGESQELFDCANANCSAECFPPAPMFPALECSGESAPGMAGACVTIAGGIACNPVTNEGCNTMAGEACDVGMGGFQCYPSGNVKNLCETCGANDADFCKPGFSCVGEGECGRYCCSDTDCGAGTCLKTLEGQALFTSAPDLGICVAGMGGGTGGAGMGGAMP
jgi:hypothetical protein